MVMVLVLHHPVRKTLSGLGHFALTLTRTELQTDVFLKTTTFST